MVARVAVLSILAVYLSVASAPAQAGDPSVETVRLDTPSGYPVPRFLSLKDDETNCRIGPSLDHSVRFVLRRAGAPVLVIAESVDHWRKVRDADGDECWVHERTLKAQTHALIRRDTLLWSKPGPSARKTGRLGPGVLAKLGKHRRGWLFLSVGGTKGWAESADVWGGDALANGPKKRVERKN